MFRSLRLSPQLDLPLEAVTQKFAVLGTSGAGKTYGSLKLAELMLDAGAQIIALDPVGNWYSLRLAADGKGKGFSIPVFGGLRGDLPLESGAGALVAKVVVEKGISAVLDVHLMRKHQRKEFVTAFAEELFQLKKESRSPVHLFLEEAQSFIPQKIFKGEERMLGAFEDLTKIGRNYGIGWTIISQRPQAVNKDALNLAGTLFVFRLIGKHERKAVEDWIEEKDLDLAKAVKSLPSLENGVCYCWSPEFLKTFEKARVSKRVTFDASETPQLGAKPLKPRELSRMDVAELRESLKAMVERVEQDDPRALRRRIADLERQKGPAKATTPVERIKEVRIEVPVIKAREAQTAEVQSGLLEGEVPPQPGEGREGEPPAQKGGLEGGEDVGIRTVGPPGLRPAGAVRASVGDSLEALERDWRNLPFEKASQNFILGDLKLDADILFVGEAPGQDEDEIGRPFVGAAGVRLDDTLEKVRMGRKDLSVTNVYPRRPDGNREPTKAEIEANRPFVDRLIKLHPNLKAIGLLGGVALKSLTGQEKIESYRGEQFQRDSVWYVPMYHPAAVLYQQSNLKWLVQDLSWLKTLSEGKAFDVSGRVFTYYDDEAFLADWSDIGASSMSYLDIESAASEGVSPLWWWDSRVWPVLMSFGWYEGDSPESCVVEVNEKTLPLIRGLMATPVKRWGGSNSLYFDFPFLRKRGMAPTCKVLLDSYPISRLNDENRGCGLKDLAKRHFSVVGHTPYWGEGEEKVWHSRWRHWAEMGQPEREERIRYSGLDAWLGVQVLSKEIARLKQKPHLVSAYVRAVLPQADAIEEMNAEGMPLDVDAAKSMMAELEETKARLVRQIGSLVPTEAWPKKKTTRSVKKEKVVSYAPVEEINFVSYQQVGHILFKGAGLPATKRTKKTGSDSSDEEALLKLMDLEGGQYPSWAFSVIRGVLDVRDATKKHGYVEALLKASDASEDHRVHGTFKIGPVTWRLASENPNEQQLDSTIKALFRAPEGWTFVKFDYNALEVRGLADQSRDPKLVQRLLENMDLHWVHATGFLGRDYDSTVEHAREGENNLIRYAFKTLVFLSGYGGGAKRAATAMRKEFYDAGIDRSVILRILEERKIRPNSDPYLALAEAWLKWLKGEYPDLRKSFYRYGAPYDEGRFDPNGYPVWRDRMVRSKFGFERRVPEIRDYDNQFRSEAHRQAYNFPSQNLSILTFLAYRELRKLRADLGMERSARLCLQEHDSKLWLVRKEEAAFWAEMVRGAMEQDYFAEFKTDFAIPLKVEGEISEVWH